jgi:copper chaperone NosL
MLALLPAACGPRGAARPAPLDTANEACRWCRMAVSNVRFAAQLAAPGEEARFFDDVGCLRDFLREGGRLPPGTIAYVADHRTRAWVPAADAVYTRVSSLQTPMGSHLVAHADATSRDADPDVAGGTPLTPGDVFSAGGPPRDQP